MAPVRTLVSTLVAARADAAERICAVAALRLTQMTCGKNGGRTAGRACARARTSVHTRVCTGAIASQRRHRGCTQRPQESRS